MRSTLRIFLFGLSFVANAWGSEESEYKEYHPYDGWYNNRAHPEWGVVESALERILEPHYQDGTYAPSGYDRPNPRLISNETMSGLTGEGSYQNRTAFLVFFGQQVVEEILDAQRPGCPPEYFNIEIPRGDQMYDPDSRGNIVIPFLRSRYVQSNTGYNPNNPREQMNEITPWMDGGLTYGVNKAWADGLRLFRSNCPERNPSSPDYVPNILAGEGERATDCRGELASFENQGRFPVENSLGLPLANPPPPRDHPELKPVYRFFRLGNPRGNENPFLLTFGILWFRHHNWLARRIREMHPDYHEEKVYNEARAMNIAIHQKIIMYDWLPALLGPCDAIREQNGTCEEVKPYSKYNPSVHPGISHAFQSAAMRWGHTLVPPGVFRRGPYNATSGTCEFFKTTRFTAGTRHEFQEVHENRIGLRTCNTYWNSIEAPKERNDIDTLIMGMASQICEREDNIITPDLRGNVFGFLDFSRRDLMAINIQRGRDHGLPDYMTARRNLGLRELTSFEEINPYLFTNQRNLTTNDSSNTGSLVLDRLRDVHGGYLNRTDIWTGGLLETTRFGPGELFRAIILDQFTRIRDGDRFWYENRENRLFSDEDFEFIQNTTIRDVILRVNPNITVEDIQMNPFTWNPENDSYARCPQPQQLSELDMEECTAVKTYDYFTGSEVSFALTFAAVGLFAIGVIVFLFCLGKKAEQKKILIRKRAVAATKLRSKSLNEDDYDIAFEVLGQRNRREVKIKFGPEKIIQILSSKNRRLRTIDLTNSHDVVLTRSYNKGRDTMFLRTNSDTHDLVLKFNDSEERDSHVVRLQTFLQSSGIEYSEREVSVTQLLEQANTKEMRDELLKRFFKTALAASIQLESINEQGITEIALSKEARKFIHVELSKEEFADYMKLKPNSMFVEQMFNIADSDQSGAISFREFLDIMVLFTKGSPRDKAKLMFDMYDLDKSGELSVDEFRVMLKSMMEMVNASVAVEQLDDVVNTVMSSHGFGSKQSLTLDDFQKIMSNYQSELSDASLQTPVSGAIDRDKQKTMMHAAKSPNENRGLRARRTVREYADRSKRSSPGLRKRDERQSKIHVEVHQKNYERNFLKQKLIAFENYVQNYRLHIFWLSLYVIVTAAIFAERCYFFSVEREWAGLRRIAGYGVSVTRGAASGMMFTYSCLLVTMSRNVITALRETALHRYIPFDSAVTMHRIIAWMALAITAVHILGHTMNFYSVSTQPPGDVTCLFRDYYRASHILPTFHYWCWQTITGLTGIFCTVIVIIMYTFASDYARQRVFQWFWWSHKIGFVSLYFCMIFHGTGFLVQRPFFYYFFLGPVILYTLDKLYSLSRNKAEIAVVRAELLPSEVTYLEFKRPTNFDYKAGQWVRIACLAQSPGEYHPFTLTSAPSEDTLKLHIRAVGPWTINLRSIYDPEVLRDSPYPKLYLDGPFGEGHQDWYKFEVAVLVGGGIGVTPFASILKDLISVAQTGTKIACKKVYFMWITRDQKQYEWLTDIIEEVENKDTQNLLDTHIFITQFPQKFDLRTTMLYICERHFQKVAGKSLFTGLRAVTHFGRPDFGSFFTSLAEEHEKVERFGVFSCGPPPMTNGVDKTCAQMNKYEGASFIHHFENF